MQTGIPCYSVCFEDSIDPSLVQLGGTSGTLRAPEHPVKSQSDTIQVTMYRCSIISHKSSSMLQPSPAQSLQNSSNSRISQVPNNAPNTVASL